MPYGSSDYIAGQATEVEALKEEIIEADRRYRVVLKWWEAAEKENEELKKQLVDLWGRRDAD